MTIDSDKDICIRCIKCKIMPVHIFHDSGDFYLECWQHSIHPDIRSYVVEIDR